MEPTNAKVVGPPEADGRAQIHVPIMGGAAVQMLPLEPGDDPAHPKGIVVLAGEPGQIVFAVCVRCLMERLEESFKRGPAPPTPDGRIDLDTPLG